MIAIEKQNRTS